jgi:hypothetical protein
MALLFIDSFDHYDNNSAKDKYLATGFFSIQTPGRHGNSVLLGSAQCALNPTSSRVIIGAAYNLRTNSCTICRVDDDPIGSVFEVSTTNSGAIQASVFGGPNVITGNDIIRNNQWFFIETDAVIDSVFTPPYYHYILSSIRVTVDGVVVLNSSLGSGVILANPPSAAKWSRVTLGTASNSIVLDDLYICDGSGPAPFNAPLGDIRIDVIRPNGAGLTTEWSPFPVATPNWDTNNDVNPDDDTTYVTAPVAGPSDLYNMEDVSTGNTIIAAQVLVNARRTDEGFANLASLVRHAGVTNQLTNQALSPTYFYRNRDILVKMPNGDALTDANINAMQVGFKRTL